ncbi:MAG TPA: ABC transporter ATP-binding protein/permease [Candidatus Anaerostipes avistercoris]|uniref:ABC transporter ATP-binding protein/permease n=1 Tax=Candidatus Anaerostipes avistercoris TaxID=2838462 RepID=A0A9D2PIP6_9FIRM|nr:ABC transporter ATP-binding protein/permease [Candidatus Anaerostipes avistercoris]
MIGALKIIWQFAGPEKKYINQSVILGFFFAVFHMFQVAAVYYVVLDLISGKQDMKTAWTASAILAASIIGRGVMNYFTQLKQTHAGYFMAGNKRIAIGDKMKSVPMGYFNDNNLGEITGVVTTVLSDVETTAPMVLVNILGGFINSIVFILMVFIFDWRIGYIVLFGIALYLLITSKMERKSREIVPKRQKSEARLVAAVLEQIRGMSVIKSFNLTGKGDQRVRDALEDNRKFNLDIEKLFTPYNIAQEITLHAFSVVIMAAAVVFYIQGAMGLADALMSIIISFMVFGQIESAGSGMAILRVASSSIEHANQTDGIPQMDKGGAIIIPESHDIDFSHVSFSYDKKEILHDISVRIPDKTTTAVIGPSGSGKTTMCSLIARFWDVQKGSIKIGGKDIRDYTLESLMDQISMVFQNVYLFADTIENNIKFGKPDASHDEVVRAAKKACCHEFIMKLPQKYDTVIGEGGNSLSGGEKQRISIARAMLKDAPIIIFDEATANVDPENEDRLQKAMEALTRNKTIIMIAHRLKTVRNADQILVLHDGSIVQRGNHEDLIRRKGYYSDFVLGRQQAAGWKLKAEE